MKITTKTQIWKVILAVNCIAMVVVASAILLLYPEKDWLFELTLSLSLTFGLATPMTYFMANQLLKNHVLTRELQRLVDRDRLTDVATRDFFFERMDAAPDSYGTSLMVDIDHFKSVNDTYGHLAGDKVIRRVAELLSENVRNEDIVARFGGEEFVVFLNGQDPETGFRVAERMRDVIAANAILIGDQTVDVTVSIGGSLKTHEEDIEQAIHHADAALYCAKREGRNRTIFSSVSLKKAGAALAPLVMRDTATAMA